jgi:putative SOS response-associated peptidase YedK
MAALKHPSSGTVILITREATKKLSTIHSRMPLVLRSEALTEWLDPTISFRSISHALIDQEEYSGSRIGFKGQLIIDAAALAPHVNSVKNTGPECLQTLKHYKEESFKNGIGRFFTKNPSLRQ